MGVVYLARDPRLNRHVAIKVLPDALARDAAHLGRFRREAMLLASLNHPNIAAIHAVEEADGQQLLVLEYVPGETLADRLAHEHGSSGRLNVKDACALALQIASALEAAHDSGIVHRDLKPANIRIRPDGTIKVLDFGLAKALDLSDAGESGSTQQSAGSSRLSTEPTMTSPAVTQIGTILGTAAYMSPEQARGQTVDKRADMWAFGVVLYEMLTGAALFRGDTVTDVIASVVTREPDWQQLPADTPAPIRRLLRRCLQKDPKSRLRDASDARLEIEEALSPHADHASAVTAPLPRRQPRLMMGLAVSILAIASGIAIGYALFSARPNDEPTILSAIVAGRSVDVTISPDGAWLAAVVNRAIQVRRLDQTSWRELPGTTGAAERVFWSPDSKQVGFSAGTSLKRVDLVGSRAQTICDCISPGSTRGATWSSSGVIIVAGGSPNVHGGLWAVPAEGGATRTVTTLDAARGENSHRFPWFLPDGRRFLFTVRRSNGEHEIRLGSLDGAESTAVVSAFSESAYASGHLLFVRSEALIAQPFDLERGTVSGDPATIAEGVRYHPAVGDARFSVSDNGTIVYGSAPVSVGVRWYDRTGRQIGALTDAHSVSRIRISPDDRRVAVSLLDLDKAASDVYILDDSRARTRLTSHPNWEESVVWSVDGTHIAYRAVIDRPAIFIQRASGGDERRLIEPADRQRMDPVDWSPDGKSILVEHQTPTGLMDLVLVGVADGTVTPVAATKAQEEDGRFSPDGKFIVYASTESGSMQIHVRGVDNAAVARRVTTSGGHSPVWSRDGGELFFVDHENWITSVPVQAAGSAITLGSATRLFKRGVVELPQSPFDVDAKGRFVMFQVDDPTATESQTIVNVLMNWTKLIK